MIKTSRPSKRTRARPSLVENSPLHEASPLTSRGEAGLRMSRKLTSTKKVHQCHDETWSRERWLGRLCPFPSPTWRICTWKQGNQSISFVLLFFPWNFVFLCVSNHVSTAPEFVFLTCPHLCLCARPPFCQQGSWNMFQWIFLIYFNLLICCVYLSLHLPFSNKEAGTCLDEGNFTTSNSFTSKYLKGQLGIGTPCESRKSVCNVFAYSRPASLPQSLDHCGYHRF